MAGRGNPLEKRQIDARRGEAARLALMGWSHLRIGLHLYADPAHNSRGRAVPQGYGVDRYEDGREPLSNQRLAEAVAKDISRAVQDARTELEENVDALRRQRVDQYQLLLEAAFREADLDRDPDDDLTEYDDPKDRAAAADRRHRARAQIIQILTRLDTVQGVARPVRTEVTGADGAPLLEPVSLSELEKLIAAAGAGQATPSGAEAAGADES